MATTTATLDQYEFSTAPVSTKPGLICTIYIYIYSIHCYPSSVTTFYLDVWSMLGLGEDFTTIFTARKTQIPRGLSGQKLVSCACF